MDVGVILQGGTLQLPNVQFPVLGAKTWIGITFLLHISVAAWSMGVVIMAPTYEVIGRLTGDGRWDRYARGISTINIRLFSFGAVWGSFAVFSLTGLYPHLFVSLATIFFIPLVYAFSSWFITIVALIFYVYRWDAWAAHKWRHIGVGYLGGIVEHSFLFFIVGVDSFMLTPRRSIGYASFFNASFWPELFHRFVGSLSMVSFSVAAVMIVYGAIRWESRDAPYYRWAARLSVIVGFALLIPQALGGVAYVEAVKIASPGAFHYSFTGSMSWLWIVQQAFFGIVLLGTNLYLWRTRTAGGPLSPALTLLTAALSVLSLLPSPVYEAVLPRSLFWIRYVFFGLSLLLSLAHLLVWRPWLRVPRPDLDRLGRWAVALAGVTAVALVLLMGVIRETTKDAGSGYAVYGMETQSRGQDIFKAPNGRWYP
jgi:Cytochrome bd terminal oxidase subunit I